MAGRPPKKGIDYAGWSVDIFDNDTKIDKLLESRGWEGFGIYFYLCQRAYGGEGYFYRWSYDDSASTSRKMGCGISAGTVRETVGYCLHIGLFNKGLFDRQGILTSRGIQRRYWEVVKARDVRAVISDYWLLQDEECKGLIKLPLNMDLSKGNANFPAGNSNNDVGNCYFPIQKESKGKERKVKENNICAESGNPPAASEIISLILNDKTFYPIYQKDIDEWKELYPAVDILQELRKMKGWCIDNPRKRKTRNGVRRFIGGWLSREQDRGGTNNRNCNLENWANE